MVAFGHAMEIEAVSQRPGEAGGEVLGQADHAAGPERRWVGFQAADGEVESRVRSGFEGGGELVFQRRVQPQGGGEQTKLFEPLQFAGKAHREGGGQRIAEQAHESAVLACQTAQEIGQLFRPAGLRQRRKT